MTHIKVLYLKPNFSLEKVISAQFLLTSGNFFGNYRLLNKPYSTAISIVKDDNFHKYYIGNRDIYTYKGENRENQIVYHEHSPIGERYLEFHGMPDKSLAEFEDILEVINFTIFNGEFGKDPDIEFS